MRITVITAAYNSAATLRGTIESVLRQEYEDVEYIIMDGGSDDGTIDIIRDVEPYFQGRLKWISEKDASTYDAMNKGIRMATGEVVGLLNSDDFFTSTDVLGQVAKAFEDKTFDAVYGDVHYVDPLNLSRTVRYYSSKSFRPWMMHMGFMPAHPSFYARKEVYEKYGCFDIDFKIGADFECLLRLIYVHKIRTKYLDLDFVTMRHGGMSTSGFKSHLQILKDHRLAYKKNHVYSNIFLEGIRYLVKGIGSLWFRYFGS